ncbi:cytochrome P450 [Halomonas eurihalina]|uniref:Cytochrome P450 n=1 Tax=Halomonas eurihalina TaxID=42566 RepID=A0A5D9DAR1_HALER|nr:cytochrome P450 [Halomonas eurihalina]MDR5859288.1 cytochrome P450 [Halomonas eurihalina]TZG40886.1 cytochrome P450 [Halomonas eurihalina]
MDQYFDSVSVKGDTAPESTDHDTAREQPSPSHRPNLRESLAREIARLAENNDEALSIPEESPLNRLGLDSLAAVELTAYIERHFHVKLPLMSLFGSMTLGQLIDLVEETRMQESAGGSLRTPLGEQSGACAVALHDWQVALPLFCIPGSMGVATYLSSLCTELAGLASTIAFQSPGIDGTESPLGSVEELARRYIAEMQTIQPEGPYRLAGHSFGGLVAHEMACQLHERGERIEALFLIDTFQVRGGQDASDDIPSDLMALYELHNITLRLTQNSGNPISARKLESLTPEKQREWLTHKLGNRLQTSLNRITTVHNTNYTAMMRFRPRYYPGPATLLCARSEFPAQLVHPARSLHFCTDEPDLGWKGLCASLNVITVPGDHLTMVRPPHVQALAEAMRPAMDAQSRLSLGMDRLLPARPPRAPGRALEISRHGISFDPYHPDHVDDPYPFLSQLRDCGPVLKDTVSRWWLTRHAEVSAGLRDKRFGVDPRGLAETLPHLDTSSANFPFLSALSRQQEEVPFSQHLNRFMLFLDPPQHQQLRRVFSPLFTPEAVKHWAGYIDECAEELIGNLRQNREADLIKELALPLPAAAISEILGFPRADVPEVLPWGQDMISGFDPLMSDDTAARINHSAEEFSRYIREHLETQRKVKSGPGILDPNTALDQGLSIEELVTHYALMFAVGFETTTDMIGNSALALLRHPDQLERWQAHPEISDNAVEELLRYDGPVRCSIRYALEDLDFGGRQIRRGEMVVFSFSAANRDPQAFREPDRLDLGRDTRRHVAFAHGAHYCLGAHLARIELRRVLPALIQHDFSLAPGGTQWRPSLVFRGLETLRIRNH